MAKKIHNLAVVNNKTFEASKAANIQHYDINSALQTTLELNELISIFCQKIQAMIPHSAFVYTNSQFAMEFKQGIAARHACNYSLKVENQSLGELKLMRQKRFTEDEITNLESLLCCLVYPLKNATLYKKAMQMAHNDPLTNTKNRTAFNDIIQREYDLANRNSNPLSLIFIDIDYFKSINDTYGHESGDIALTSIADWIKESVRSSDIVFRYGGEEFVVLLSETNLDAASDIAERIRATIENHTLAFGMKTLKITASLGVSSLRGNDTIETLICRADTTMYQAKNSGRNQVRLAR